MDMKKLLLSIFLLLALNSFSQKVIIQETTFDSLWHKACDFLYVKKQADSALLYYKQITQQFPSNNDASTFNVIGDCYIALQDTANAKLFYSKCLAIDRNISANGIAQQEACLSLADIYYNGKQYNKALTYFNSAHTIYKPLIGICSGGADGQKKLMFAYKKAYCYYGINKKHSAINQLAPLIVSMANDVFVDTASYKEVVHFFASTIVEMYGVNKAKRKLNSAIKNINYTTNYEESFGAIMCMVTCYIPFGKTKINIHTSGGVQVSSKGEIPPNSSKQILVEKIRNSYLYKCVMHNETYN